MYTYGSLFSIVILMTIVRSISDANTANTISDDQRKAFVALFPQYAELSSGEQDKLIQKVLNNANDLNEDSKEFAEKVEKNIFESTKNNKDMEEQLTKKEEEKSEKIQDLYTKLDEQEEEITGLKKERKNLRSNLTRSKGQYKKDLTSATSIEFGPLTVRRLILLKRQQTKLQHFMKNDPKAGMRYAYYNGMFGVRHLKRALHKK
jgi:seryl-tRNA synthetase